MEIRLDENRTLNWKVEKIAVIGPGIVGMPMAALLANARIRIGTDRPAKVVVVQRNSINSGWKVDAINAGNSVIGGIEPGLNTIASNAVEAGILLATHDYEALADADLILVCVQTDKKPGSFEPDYEPLFGGLTALAQALQHKPAHKVPLIVFESTLAPSSMTTLIREHFERYGLVEGQDILLGNSPNRVMPGRLVERVTGSDKLVAGLHPKTPGMIKEVYRHIVTGGALHQTNSMTAEVVKTLENAYRDVRIAYSSEIVRYCDEHDIDFYAVRDRVNEKLAQVDEASANPNAVPSGGLLIPMVGVGGHCLPKDGILLWWRRIDSGFDPANSLILKARLINDESPSETIRLAERRFGSISGAKVAVLGAAYRFNSEDTRNSPSIVLARQLMEKGCKVTLHDPYVKPGDQNLVKFKVDKYFTNNLPKAVAEAEYLFFGTAHRDYMHAKGALFALVPNLKGIVDACNLYQQQEVEALGYAYAGIGRGRKKPDQSFINFVYRGFQAMEKGLANEVLSVTEFLNEHYVSEEFNQVKFREVQRLAASCNTGCVIVGPGPVEALPAYRGFHSRLVERAYKQHSLISGRPASSTNAAGLFSSKSQFPMSYIQKHWGIVGGGMLGMQLANLLVKQGQRVTILEAGPSLGGLTSAWKIGSVSWDKFYHVILLSDMALRGLLKEIGLRKQARWVETKTGFYTGGKLYSMSNTLEFLQFPPLSLVDKLRLGFTIFYASRITDWKRLEGIPVADWLKRLSGENTFNKIWLPLLRAKLGENYKHTSAAFIWATIQRMYAARRTGLKKEMFGYLEGGYACILDSFSRHLLGQGVEVRTGFRASRVSAANEGGVIVEGLEGQLATFDEVILTVPSPIAARLCEGMKAEEKEKHRNIEYLGVVCASVLLKKSLSPFYVTNVTDDSPFTGVIEMTNIVPPAFFGGHALVYLPKYVKKSDPIFQWSDEEIKQHFRDSLLGMYRHITEDDLVRVQVARAPHVFALSTLHYSEKLPSVSTSVPGVHILNSAHIVNGTLNVNETLHLADRMLPGILQKAGYPKTISSIYE